MNSVEGVAAMCKRMADGVGPGSAVATFLGYPLPTRYPDTPASPALDDVTRCRAVLTIVASAERQRTLAPAGSRRYETGGTVYAQLYAPASRAGSGKLLADLAELVAVLYRGVSEPRGVWYRDITIQSQPATAEWYIKRVGGRFAYDRIG